MKTNFNKKVLTVILMMLVQFFSMKVLAQISDQPTNAPLRITFYSWTMFALTDAFNGLTPVDYDYGSITYSKSEVVITINHKQKKCIGEKVCVDLQIAPSIIALPVKNDPSVDCYDTLYAANEDESAQIFVTKFSVERCPTFAKPDNDGEVFYHLKGISKYTGEKTLGRARWILNPSK